MLATLPSGLGNSYYINIASQILIFAVFALGLNVLVGYAGLVSLGHAGLFGVAAYAGGDPAQAGHGPSSWRSARVSRHSWYGDVRGAGAARDRHRLRHDHARARPDPLGLAYRWISLTNGDNGINVTARPAPFGLSLARRARVLLGDARRVPRRASPPWRCSSRSPFGASLRGTRDQPRRMTALGYNVWLIRFLAFLFSGFWSGVAGLLYLYYNQFISPQTVALSASAEALLMVIAGGTATLLGPIAGAALVVIMKNVASAYIERWNFVLGAIFVAIVVFMPEGLVPGSVRLWRWASRRCAARPCRRTGRESGQ